MPWRNRRPVARRILALTKDSRVGYWQLPDVFEVAHYYHRIPGAESSLEHRFCYRNYRVETFVLNRSVTVNGPAHYVASDTISLLQIVARQSHRNPNEIIEHPSCGTLHPEASGQLLTDVTLTPVQSYDTRLPEKIPMISVGQTEGLDICCP
jgi:hypothetical protein